MSYIDRETGKVYTSLVDEVQQNVKTILTTPIGSRVMRREFGSRLFSLLDSKLDRIGLAEIYAATYDAILRWEPRIVVSKVTVLPQTDVVVGKLLLNLRGIVEDTEVDFDVSI